LKVFSRRSKRWLLFLSIVLAICFPIVLIKLSTFTWLSGKGDIGNAIGGITSPFVGLIGAILVYLSFEQQIEANRIQRLALRSQIIQEQRKGEYVLLEKHLAEIKAPMLFVQGARDAFGCASSGVRRAKSSRRAWVLLKYARARQLPAEGHIQGADGRSPATRSGRSCIPTGRISPGRRKGATRDGCLRNINEITRSAPIRRRIASFMRTIRLTTKVRPRPVSQE